MCQFSENCVSLRQKHLWHHHLAGPTIWDSPESFWRISKIKSILISWTVCASLDILVRFFFLSKCIKDMFMLSYTFKSLVLKLAFLFKPTCWNNITKLWFSKIGWQGSAAQKLWIYIIGPVSIFKGIDKALSSTVHRKYSRSSFIIGLTSKWTNKCMW